MHVPNGSSLVAPVGFEPNVAGVKGRLPDQLEEGTINIRFVITDKAFATINSVCAASLFLHMRM